MDKDTNAVKNVVIPQIKDIENISFAANYFIYHVGENMHKMAPFLVLIPLRNHHMLFLFYFIGFCISVILNFIMKFAIQQRRPCINVFLFEQCLKNGETHVKRNNKKYFIYGMPSGHSQIVGYTLSFIVVFLKDKWISFIFFMLTILTMYQRILYQHHTLLQTLVGVSIGLTSGLIMHHYSVKYIEGPLYEKPDDDCHIR